MKIIEDTATHLIIKDTRRLPPRKSMLLGAALLLVSLVGGFLAGRVSALTCTRTDSEAIACVMQSSWFGQIPLGADALAALEHTRLDTTRGGDSPDVVLHGAGGQAGEIRISSTGQASADAIQSQIEAFMDDVEAEVLALSFTAWPANLQVLVGIVAIFVGVAGLILLLNGLRPKPNIWVFDKPRELLLVGVSQDDQDVQMPTIMEEHPFYTLGRVTTTEDRDGDFQVHVEVQRTPHTLPGYNKNRDEVQQMVERIRAITDA